MNDHHVISSNSTIDAGQMVRLIQNLVHTMNNQLATRGKFVKTLNLKINTDTGDIDLAVKENSLSDIADAIKYNVEAGHQDSRARLSIILTKVKKALNDRAFDLAESLLNEATSCADSLNLESTHHSRKVINECHRYISAHRDTSSSLMQIDLNNIRCRDVILHKESFHYMPQSIFFISIKDMVFVGRKTLSQKWIKGEINDLVCAHICKEMLLGVLANNQITENGVWIYYYPISASEKHTIFEDIRSTSNAEITFPFPYLTKSEFREIESQPEGWTLCEDTAEDLARGEREICQFTIEFLRDFKFENKTLYDPACSTGHFLQALKQAYPSCRTVGQDLSKDMVRYARQFVDKVYHGDAIHSKIKDESVDMIFCRFLNSEVVTTEYAGQLFDAIAKRLKPDGYLFVLGHTPILLNAAYFTKSGFKVIRTHGYDEPSQCIFQFYVLQKRSTRHH